MREAIALIIVILMGAFAATQAQWATPYTPESQQAITQRVISYIDAQENAWNQDRMPKIQLLLTAWKKNQDNPLIHQSLATVTNYLMDLQEQKTSLPSYKTL